MSNSESGEKTEKATPKKRKDAREKGQVKKSSEVVTAVVMLGLFGTIKIFGNFMANNMKYILTIYLSGEAFVNLDVAGFSSLFLRVIILFLYIMAPIFGVGVLLSLLANMMQIGWLFSSKAIQPKFDKLNPLSGLKRMVSIQALYEMLKSIFKLSIIIAIAFVQIKSNIQMILNTMHIGAIQSIPLVFNAIINTCFAMCSALAIFSVIDYVYQWFKYEKELKMTKYEVKTEFKQMEGDPQIKHKRQAIHRQMAAKRMMNSVPDSDVVITNPTHFAVALKYEQNSKSAPIVVAKGQDRLALRIKEIAKDNNVEIVENKPVARALYAACEVGSEIPVDMYQTVAQILADVYLIKKGGHK